MVLLITLLALVVLILIGFTAWLVHMALTKKKKELKTQIDPYLSISPVDVPKDYRDLEEKAKDLGNQTGLIGDNALLTKEAIAKQEEADAVKREAKMRKAVQEAIDHNMDKQKDAFDNTMYEVMHGHPRPEVKKDVAK